VLITTKSTLSLERATAQKFNMWIFMAFLAGPVYLAIFYKYKYLNSSSFSDLISNTLPFSNEVPLKIKIN